MLDEALSIQKVETTDDGLSHLPGFTTGLSSAASFPSHPTLPPPSETIHNCSDRSPIYTIDSPPRLYNPSNNMPVKKGAPAHGSPANLLPPSWTSVISVWLAEDTPSFDYGGFVVGSAPAEARLLAKSPGILAGVPFFDEIFKYLGCTVEWNVEEGVEVGKQEKKQCVAIVKGPTRNLLLGERVALNVLARCSGVATK